MPLAMNGVRKTMKHMTWKRLLAPVLSLALALSLAACGGTADEPEPENPVQSGAESNKAENSQPPADTGTQGHPTDGIGAWLPPTDTGLAGTVWETEDDWLLRLEIGGADAPYAGEAVLSCRTADGGDAAVCYTGSWGVEDDCLRLDLKDADGADRYGLYPVLISPSGEELNLQQGSDGAVPPFFAEGVTSMDLRYCYE